jgi:hypothetical protein
MTAKRPRDPNQPVSVLWRGGEVDTIFGFEKEADALQWIKEKSQAWLLETKKAAN